MKANYESDLHEIGAQYEAEKQCASSKKNQRLNAEVERKLRTAIKEKFNVEAELKKSEDCQVKHGDLIGRLKAVTDDRNRAVLDAKNDVAKIKAQCANEKMRLSHIHDEATAVASARIGQLERGKELLCKDLKSFIQNWFNWTLKNKETQLKYMNGKQ